MNYKWFIQSWNFASLGSKLSSFPFRMDQIAAYIEEYRANYSYQFVLSKFTLNGSTQLCLKWESLREWNRDTMEMIFFQFFSRPMMECYFSKDMYHVRLARCRRINFSYSILCMCVTFSLLHFYDRYDVCALRKVGESIRFWGRFNFICFLPPLFFK